MLAALFHNRLPVFNIGDKDESIDHPHISVEAKFGVFAVFELFKQLSKGI